MRLVRSRLRLAEQVAELRERIHVATSDSKEYALQKSERARNAAIGVLGFVALVFGIAAGLYLFGLAFWLVFSTGERIFE